MASSEMCAVGEALGQQWRPFRPNRLVSVTPRKRGYGAISGCSPASLEREFVPPCQLVSGALGSLAYEDYVPPVPRTAGCLIRNIHALIESSKSLFGESKSFLEAPRSQRCHGLGPRRLEGPSVVPSASRPSLSPTRPAFLARVRRTRQTAAALGASRRSRHSGTKLESPPGLSRGYSFCSGLTLTAGDWGPRWQGGHRHVVDGTETGPIYERS